MKHHLHDQIQALRRKSGPIRYANTGTLNVSGEVRGMSAETALDKRIIQGYLFTWAEPNRHREKFNMRAFDKTIRENGPNSGSPNTFPLLWQHDPAEPLAKLDVVEPDRVGLFIRSKPLDDITTADRALKQVRSGTVNGFSGGFYPMWEKSEWNEDEEIIIHNEVMLLEASLVTIPSDANTFVKRSAEEINDILDQVEYFIRSLPKNRRLEARHILTLYKSLEDGAEPLKAAAEALDAVTPEPVKRSIDYRFLIDNLKL